MSKLTLGGFIFFKEPEKFDYCYVQAVKSLSECCDKVSIVCFEDDWEIAKISDEVLFGRMSNVEWHKMCEYSWDDMKGKTKLANFQNIAAMFLDTDYQLLIQADEVLTEDSYDHIRKSMETGGNGFMCSRVNLWGDPNHMLVVPQNRQPCSTQVIRLTKRGYWCYDDGESIAAPASYQFVDKIKIIHYGFVRKREVMKSKIINMQRGVFGMENYDPKLDQCEVFDPSLWFSGNDLAPIDFTHPKIMNQWVIDRM